MPFVNSNDFLTGTRQVVTPAGCEVVAVRFPIDLALADLDINDCGAVAILPAGCVPVGLIYDSDDLDSGGSPSIMASVGPINGTDSDLLASWASSITFSQSGIAGPVALTTAAMRFAPVNTDTRIGLKFTAGSAIKAAGQVGLTLMYRAA